MKSFKSYILLFICSIFTYSTWAQSIEASVEIDSSSMRIGEQRHIFLTVKQPQSANVKFPFINQSDTLVPGVEILAISKLDTTNESDGRIKISQEILVTSFDTGRYTIPPFKFITKTKQIDSEKTFLNVSTIEADFVNSKITDIEENYDPGINWVRLFLYLSILLILAGLGYIGYMVYQFYQRKKLENAVEEKEVDNRLPHEIALAELNEIQEQKVWKQGFTKQYYTNITDTLREYFTKRFGISAMEMTSAEIIDRLKYDTEAAPILDKLRQIFSTSDMVKFAKQEPTQEENELSILNAYRIINETIIVPSNEEAPQENSASNDKKTE